MSWILCVNAQQSSILWPRTSIWYRKRPCRSNPFELEVLGLGTILTMRLPFKCLVHMREWSFRKVVKAQLSFYIFLGFFFGLSVFFMINAKYWQDVRLWVSLGWLWVRSSRLRNKQGWWRYFLSGIRLRILGRLSRSMFARGWWPFISLRRGIGFLNRRRWIWLFHKAATWCVSSLIWLSRLSTFAKNFSDFLQTQ